MAEKARVTVRWSPDRTATIRARERSFVVNKARGSGDWTSTELLLATLASCTTGTVMNHEWVREQPITGFEVEMEAEMSGPPQRVGSIHMRLKVEGDLGRAELERIARIAGGCTIHNTLRSPPALTLDWELSAPSGEVVTGVGHRA